MMLMVPDELALIQFFVECTDGLKLEEGEMRTTQVQRFLRAAFVRGGSLEVLQYLVEKFGVKPYTKKMNYYTDMALDATRYYF